MITKEKVHFKTFGCRTNQFDTQVMISKLKDFELSSSEIDADVIVVNSCTVTNGADSSVRHYINSVKRKNPNARVVLAGCGSHSKGEALLADKKVFGVMGHSEKENINEILKKPDSFYEIGDLEHIDSTIVEEFVGKSRAFIKVQEGCDFACSYCIIPAVRGGARSHAEDTVVAQVKKLSDNGFGEFILTGTNVGSYGRDHGSSMTKLLKKISQLRGVRRIRIGSLEPIQIDDEFKELLDEPWMAKHLHIALQHTSDKMLRIMNRRNDFSSDKALFEELSSHGYALGTDFIVGHPGEDDEAWSEAMDRMSDLPLTHVHAFTYSRRDGTAAATMSDVVRGDIAKPRHQELTALIREKNYKFRKENQHNLEVLLESRDSNVFKGFDQYFNRVEVSSAEDLSSTWLLLNSVEVNHKGNIAKFTI